MSKKTDMKAFLKMPDPELTGNDFDNAIYTLSELGMWPDTLDEQAILSWKLIEKLRKEKLPENLRM